MYIQNSTVIPIIWGIVAISFTDKPGSVLSESAADKNGNICLLLKSKRKGHLKMTYWEIFTKQSVPEVTSDI